MNETLLEWRNYRFFPYERDFARLEVNRLFNTSPSEDTTGLRIPSSPFRPELAERLTYFSRVVHPDGNTVVPLQARLEASTNTKKDNCKRQATRYSAHGLHEYKGKFNPQVVRAIGNILGLNDDAWVLDPFCGSGTTLLECAHAGWNAVGVDQNPLAIRIANAKLRALRRASISIEEVVPQLVNALTAFARPLSGTKPVSSTILTKLLGNTWIHELHSKDYLFSWFAAPVLAQIVAIQRALRVCIPSRKDREVFEIMLSDHLRDVSLQEPADLRIRRRKNAHANYPLIDMYLSAIKDRIGRVVRARRTLCSLGGKQRAYIGDVRTTNFLKLCSAPSHGFDAVISSPPYETALPYIDTQRLSLVLFGDIQASEVYSTERSLIGAREITDRERQYIEGIICKGDKNLPSSVNDLCQELLTSAKKPGNGFRRINRPALAYQYFNNMAAFFRNLRGALRPSGHVALVVGRNRTILGGKEYDIDTPRLLADIGEYCGYVRVEERQMDTYPRYDLHQKNSIAKETLIILSAP